MKIAMITPGYLPVPAVSGGAVEVLITYLIEGNEKGNHCTIDSYTCYDKELGKFRYKNTNIVKVKVHKTTQLINKVCNCWYTKFRKQKWSTSFAREVVFKIRKQKYDYVVIHNNMIAYREIYEHTENKENLIYVMHNNVGNDPNEIMLAKLVGNTAKKILAVSEFTKNHFLGIAPNDNTDVLYNCIKIQQFLNGTDDGLKELRDKYRIRKDDCVFMYSGRIDKYKGVLELVKAFRRIKEDNIKLMIVGKSWFNSDKRDEYTDRIQNEIKVIKDKIILTGFVKPEDMHKMYQLADVLVVPSIWEEPFGVVALEGMASSLPLIVTKSGGLSEIVNKNNAIIVDKNKNLISGLEMAMRIMFENKDLRKVMGREGRKLVMNNQNYNAQYYFENFLDSVKNEEK